MNINIGSFVPPNILRYVCSFIIARRMQDENRKGKIVLFNLEQNGTLIIFRPQKLFMASSIISNGTFK